MKNSKKMDYPMFVLTAILIVTGLIMLFSASYPSAINDFKNPYHYVSRQAVFAIVGFVGMYIVSLIDYHVLHRFAWAIYIVSVILLLMVALIGKEVNVAKRWLIIAGIQFQPSEIAKIGIIILFSSMAVKRQKTMRTFKDGLFPFLVLIALVAIFTITQPHLSATVIIAITGIVIIFVAGANLTWLIAMGSVGVAGVVAFIMIKGYAMTRIKVWLDPFIDATGKGWQGAQSFIAIGSGGIFGLGFGQSRQKHLYLPEPANDFIFSVICEELGLIGATIIILLFVMFAFRGFIIATKAKDKFGCLLAVGITTKFTIQTIINLFVVTGIMPITGAALPFFSYGGTALILQILEIGILLNISRQGKSL